MANNYHQWSAEIDNLTAAELDWFETSLDEEREDLADLPWYCDAAESIDFSRYIDRDECCIHFYAEESGDLESLEALIKKFIRKFRPDFIFSVTWADTCSKMRVGEFGGGAMVVSRFKTQWMNTYNYVEATTKTLQKRLAKGKKKPGVTTTKKVRISKRAWTGS